MSKEAPRRNCLSELTTAELAIYKAVEAVEGMPADVRLTDAVVLLQAARESVADFVDGIDKRRYVRDEPAPEPVSPTVASPLTARVTARLTDAALNDALHEAAHQALLPGVEVLRAAILAAIQPEIQDAERRLREAEAISQIDLPTLTRLNQVANKLRETQAALRMLQRGPNCWCDVAIDNPMYGGKHSEACKRAAALADPQAQGDTMTDHNRGLYEKFEVRRTDGSSERGQKHERCEYFVLDLDHDEHAIAALKAYAKSCRKDYPTLAVDLRKKVTLRTLFARTYRQVNDWSPE